MHPVYEGKQSKKHKMKNTNSVIAGERTQQAYWITKRFIGGVLKGLTWEGPTSTKYEVGFVCTNPIGNTSPYEIISVKEAA